MSSPLSSGPEPPVARITCAQTRHLLLYTPHTITALYSADLRMGGDIVRARAVVVEAVTNQRFPGSAEARLNRKPVKKP